MYPVEKPKVEPVVEAVVVKKKKKKGKGKDKKKKGKKKKEGGGTSPSSGEETNPESGKLYYQFGLFCCWFCHYAFYRFFSLNT